MDNLLVGNPILPLREGSPAGDMSSATPSSTCGKRSAEADHCSADTPISDRLRSGMLIGFIPE
jgi:hypothetical protein